MGRHDPHQPQECLLHHSLHRAPHDQAEVRQNHSHQLHRRTARRIVPHPLRRFKRRHHQPHQGPRHRARPSQYSCELRRSRLGGYRHVHSCAGDQSGPEDGFHGNSPRPRRDCRRSCRPHPLCRFGSGQLHDRRSHQCKWRFGLVRVKPLYLAGVAVLAVAIFASRASAQNPDTLMPEQSVAKAKQILSDLINALGGPGYTEVRESQCEGRRVLFGHSGDVIGNIGFTEFRRFPDKVRTEYIGKSHHNILPYLIGIDGLDLAHGGVVITLDNGDQGWTFDRSGVNELPAASISEFQEQVKRNIDNLLRLRLKEPGIAIRFGGNDIVDLKQVDWVEISDSQERKFRLAVDRSTHFLIRSVVITKDEENQQINEDVSIYSKYQLKDSAWTPLQISREHNGRRSVQIFYDSCKYNPGFPDELFNKTSLSKQGSQNLAKKNKN